MKGLIGFIKYEGIYYCLIFYRLKDNKYQKYFRNTYINSYFNSAIFLQTKIKIMYVEIWSSNLSRVLPRNTFSFNNSVIK